MSWSEVLNTPAQPVPLDAPKVFNLAKFDGYQDPKKLDVLTRLSDAYGHDPRLATLAVTIFRDAKVEPRDYRGQAAALLKWVQENVYYVNEPDERLQTPDYTLRVRYGDCFPAETLLLDDKYNLTPIKDIQPGVKIWGLNRWSTVEAVADKGVLAVTHIRLTNGSTVRLTENHKVYVEKCRVHGVGCSLLNPSCESVGHERIRVSELKEGAVLILPSQIPFGTEEMDPERAYVEGLYVADGSIHHKYTKQSGDVSAYDFSIAGRDGHPKEGQKHEVAEICAKLGLNYRIDKKEITVNDPTWARRMLEMGANAPSKRVLSLRVNEAAARELLRGLMADSGKNTSGGITYSTTSKLLATQFRVLQKMLGRTCGFRYVENHGGLGKHPIYRLNPRLTADEGATRTEKKLRVKTIAREVESVPCFDIQTDDHYVYLPEADVTVSNCDDMAILLFALARSVRLPVKFVISGVEPRNGKKHRYHYGDAKFPRGINWSHIYLAIGDRPYGEPTWMYAEPTLKVPLGWDVVGADSRALAEMNQYAGDETAPPNVPQVVMPQPRPWWKELMFAALAAGVGAVTSTVVLDYYKDWKKARKAGVR